MTKFQLLYSSRKFFFEKRYKVIRQVFFVDGFFTIDEVDYTNFQMYLICDFGNISDFCLTQTSPETSIRKQFQETHLPWLITSWSSNRNLLKQTLMDKTIFKSYQPGNYLHVK